MILVSNNKTNIHFKIHSSVFHNDEKSIHPFYRKSMCNLSPTYGYSYSIDWRHTSSFYFVRYNRQVNNQFNPMLFSTIVFRSYTSLIIIMFVLTPCLHHHSTVYHIKMFERFLWNLAFQFQCTRILLNSIWQIPN